MAAVWRRLDAASLEPALARRGQPALRDGALKLGQELEAGALAELEDLREEGADPEQLESYEVAVAYCAAAVAGLHYLGGETSDGLLELKAAASLTPKSEIADLLREAAADPEAFLPLLHAQWLMRNDQLVRARLVAHALLQQSPSKEIAHCARQIIDAPEPLTRAPALSSVNGCGAALFGRREVAADGSYIATRYITLLFIPVFPLDAFRVTRDGSIFHFQGKVALDARAHWIRRLVAAFAILAAIAGGGFAYLESDRHRLAVRVAAAAKLEGVARDQKARDAALGAYEQIFHDYEDKVDASRLEPAALGVARVSTLALGDALAPATFDGALGALRRFASLPDGARDGEAASFLTARTDHWAKSLGSADPECATDSLRLLGFANVALGAPALLALRERALYLHLGQEVRPKWPVLALEFIAHAAEENGASTAMDQALAGLPPTAIESLSPALDAWLDQHHGVPAFAHSVAIFEAARSRAETTRRDPGRAELLDKGSDEQLQSALAVHPDDPAYTVTLAEHLRGKGDSAQALSMLGRLGAPGQLPESAALLFARLSNDVGNSQTTEELDEQWLLARLPAYEATSFKLDRRVSAKRGELSRQADNDALPVDIKNQLDKASDAEQARKAYGEWVDGELDRDPEIKALQGTLDRMDNVLPVALDLGTSLLESAQAEQGELKARTLAKAERTFLSIESAGQGLPAYHLGLGSVYYRLGKSAEGERELQVLLARKEPKLDLRVARTYRELGQHSKAQNLAQRVFEQGDDETKKDAAVLLALLADGLAEQEKWLLLADQSSDYVKSRLTEVQASKAFRSGNLALADEKFQRAYELYINAAGTDSSSRNNAALALSSRYRCTGDERHLRRAVELLEQARHLEPSDTIVLQNLSDPLSHLGELDAVHTFLDLPTLKLSEGEVTSVLGWLEDGESRPAVLAALRQSRELRRANEVLNQARVLGPSWPDPYYAALSWLTVFEDVDGLAKLEAQVKAVRDKIDRGQAAHEREEFLSGASDARDRDAAQGAIVRYTATLAAINGPNAAASRAVIRALWAEQEYTLALLDFDPARTQKSLTLLRQAREDWPALSLADKVASALLRSMLIRVLAQASAEERRDLRRDGSTLTLWRWMKTPGSPSLAAVEAQPELAEAARVLASAPDRAQSALGFVVGTLTGNADLLRRARTQLGQRAMILAEETADLLVDSDETRAGLAMTREILGAAPATATP